MLTSIRTTTVSIGLMLALAACGREAAETPEATTAPPGTPTVAATAGTTGGAGSSLWNGGQAMPLDIQVPHPNGTVLQLTSLQSRQTETVIGIRVINGDDREVQLNRFNNRDGYVVVDSGERIYLSPPPGNTRLAVQPGQTMEGELVFLGRLPQAQTGILILNENSATDNQYTNTPGFRIDLPLQAQGGGAAQ